MKAKYALLILLSSPLAAQVPWPVDPTSPAHELGNNYGAFQDYDGSPYYHDGLDILASRGAAVYAVEGGVVQVVVDDGEGGLYSGVMIGQSGDGGLGFDYWHLESSSLAVREGDVVSRGDYLGDLVVWPVDGFHHVHFNRVRGDGDPWSWSTPVENPLSELRPNTDTSDPTVEHSSQGPLIYFCTNESSNYLQPKSLTGVVDVVAGLSDTYNGGSWELAPFEFRLEVADTAGNVVFERSSRLAGDLGDKATMLQVFYKDDNVANSQGDYNNREYFFVLTNNDGDGLIEASDRHEGWDTTKHPDGPYQVKVIVEDMSRNSVSANVSVCVDNRQDSEC